MISFVTGKPGDGKSLYATALILEDLIEGAVFVVTNIPLVPGAVCAYVAAERRRRGDGRSFSFDDSCRVLADAEVYEFYRRRSGGLVLAESPDFAARDDGTKRLERPEFVAAMKREFLRIAGDPAWQRPVHFYIDEAHNFFSAREWAQTGRGLLYYASQHRHLHDNVWFITQVMDNVEKQLRGLASETHRVRNHLRRSIGPIKLRPVFKVHSFYGTPAEGSPVSPYNVSERRLDPAGVAGCYRTVGALGVQTKPEVIKNKGVLPWWTVWLLGAVGVATLVAIFLGLPVLGGAVARRSLSVASVALANDVPLAPSTVGSSGAPPLDALPQVRGHGDGAARIWMTGWVRRGRFINVLLSDGRTLSEADGILAQVTRTFCELRDGTRYYLRLPGSGAQGAPVRPGTGVPAVALRGRTGREPAEERGADGTQPVGRDSPAPSTASESSWYTDRDGVQRLYQRPSLPSVLPGPQKGHR
jgi:hypothetical protein